MSPVQQVVEPFDLPSTAEEILSRPLEDQTDAQTVGGFLSRLLDQLLRDDENFDAKRPFGNSGWLFTLGDVVNQNELLIAIRSLSRDKSPQEIFAEDIGRAFLEGGPSPEQAALYLIEMGYHK